MNDFTNFKSDLLQQIRGQNLTEQLILNSIDNLFPFYSISKRQPQPTLKNANEEMVELFLKAKQIEEKSDKTIQLYRNTLHNYLKYLTIPIDQVDANGIRSYLYWYKVERHVQNSTLETLRRILNSFYSWCLSEGLVLRNPLGNITAIKCEEKPRTAMKRIEIAYIREACQTLRERAIIDFLFSTGCRVSEVVKVQKHDIDWDKRTIVIKQGKGNKTRHTFINAECEVSLRAYLNSRKDNSPYVFAPIRKSKNNYLTTKTIQDIVNKVVKRVEDKLSVHVTVHVFRHTAATIALKNGMPIEQVQKFLGHKNINTTMIYAEVDEDDIRMNHSKFLS